MRPGANFPPPPVVAPPPPLPTSGPRPGERAIADAINNLAEAVRRLAMVQEAALSDREARQA